MSLPIEACATNPTLRQCLLALTSFASEDSKFIKPNGFDESQLMTPAQPCAQASSRIYPLRNQVTARETTVDEGIGSHTIMFGGDDGVARSWVNCKRLIRISEEKAIFEVTWDGKPAIAKCWPPSLSRCYSDEATTYEKIYEQQPGGFDFLQPCSAMAGSAARPSFPMATYWSSVRLRVSH
ncbi:hypothetical protein SI65_05303 [Aspergillus cristatus]|uniref:Uncharacterized protein n=1 Tax=Aspergillus cristatus TaxID=573508 RepID=A0A1E3BE73_ASPCR|nr:hypothetical protein SI65_05303 [Aspergillus cristatus]